MRRDVSFQASILALALCAVLAGCGTSGVKSGGNGPSGNPPSTPPTPSATMQQGQSKFAVNDAAYYVEANMTDSGNEISSNVYKTELFEPGNGNLSRPGGIDCGNVGANGTISGNSLTGILVSGGSSIMSFTGSLNSTGQSVSNGTSSAPNEICGIPNSTVNGGTSTAIFEFMKKYEE
jgi:hypothetical protein